MKRPLWMILALATLTACLVTSVPVMAAAANWEVTVKEFQAGGNADFWLHYTSPNPHVISQLHAPQNQAMLLLEATYRLEDARDSFFRFGFGFSGNGNKGRGFDADWANSSNYDQITDYGTMNFYGQQQNFTLDYGFKILRINHSKTNAFIGLTQHKSTNELRDVIYYRSNNADINPPQGQADLGTFYNMDFKGLRLGLEQIQPFTPRLFLSGTASLAYLDTKLNAEWRNHDPIWVFEDSGHTWGYEFGLELQYKYTKSTNIQLGYTYYYAKSDSCTRIMDLGSGFQASSQLVDLELSQHGLYIGFSTQF